MDYHWKLNFEPCRYSFRLLEKLELLNTRKTAEYKVKMEEIKKAIYYAKKHHGAQMRQSGEPYYTHPLEVAYMVSDYLFRTDIIITSILHDTIEDTEFTYGMIKSIFGKLIANQVMDLTRIKEEGRKISSAEIVETLFKQKKYDVLIIKLFDRLHNMQTIGAKSPVKAAKIVKETLEEFLILAAYFGTYDVECELRKICLQIINPNKIYLQNSFSIIDKSSQLFSLDL